MLVALCFVQEGSTWLCRPEIFHIIVSRLARAARAARAAGANMWFTSRSITRCLELTPVHSKA